MLETKDLNEHQVENIAEVYQIIERMIRLNKSLLLLSKIENKQFENNEQMSMNDIINHSIQALEDFASFKKLSFTVKESSNLIIEFNPSLAEIVISNLLRNAIFHNIENGHIEVNIEAQSIKICNSGINKALEKEKLFTQFYKSNSKGSGLGLSIVLAILKIYNLKIEYQFKDSQHCFQIFF